ncbi:MULTISPECIES: hypothetical protein [unclassified Acinetobacter]|uniref:hypothetical protein n=1 Tax=unclassified Acinetobacter TaxID=196816 RepID=UPI0035B754BE
MNITLLIIAILFLGFVYQKLEDSPNQDILSFILGLLLLGMIKILDVFLDF